MNQNLMVTLTWSVIVICGLVLFIWMSTNETILLLIWIVETLIRGNPAWVFAVEKHVNFHK